MYHYLDLICKFGRWLATARSLAIQTEQLLEYLNNSVVDEVVMVEGLEL